MKREADGVRVTPGTAALTGAGRAGTMQRSQLPAVDRASGLTKTGNNISILCSKEIRPVILLSARLPPRRPLIQLLPGYI